MGHVCRSRWTRYGVCLFAVVAFLWTDINGDSPQAFMDLTDRQNRDYRYVL